MLADAGITNTAPTRTADGPLGRVVHGDLDLIVISE